MKVNYGTVGKFLTLKDLTFFFGFQKDNKCS